MADEAPKSPEQEGDQGKKKGLPLKAIIIVLVLLVGEAAGVIVAMSMLGKPSAVQGHGIETTHEDLENTLHEVLIVGDRFPNHHTGRVWLWETEVQMTVKEKHLLAVEETLEARAAEIKTGISQIIRTAHHNHLKEPNLETLTRQFREFLRQIFGDDAEGEPRVQAVLIPKCVGFPADF